MSILRRVSLALAAAAALGGCVFHTPVQMLSSTIPVGDHPAYSEEEVEGRSCQWWVFAPIFVFGDNSLATAHSVALQEAQGPGLVDVTVDDENTWYFIAGRRCTVVRGKPLVEVAPAEGKKPAAAPQREAPESEAPPEGEE
jgi:hypothetical protein